MVSTDITVDPAAVAPVADPVVPAADPSEGQAAGEVEGQAGAAVEGAVVEAAKPLSLAEVSESDLLAHLRERKTDDGFSLEDRIRKSERDTVERTRRKEAGQVESVTRRTARALEKYGVDPSEVAQDDLGGMNALSYYAHLDALGETGTAWINATMEEFGVVDRALIEDSLAKYAEDPTDIDVLASRVLHAVRDTVASKTLAEASLSDVPEGSKLHGDLKVEAQRLADVELQAREIAAKQQDSPPTAPVGAPSGSQTDQYRSMSAADAARLPDAQYREWQKAVA